MADPLLTRKKVLLAKIEAVENQDAQPTPQANAIAVSSLEVSLDANVLDSNTFRPSLSTGKISIGRKLANANIELELKGSGSTSTPPRMGALLRMCGMSETVVPATTSATIQDPVAGPGNSGAPITFAKTTAPTDIFDKYRLTVITGGISGTATAIVTSEGFPVGDNSVVPSLEHSAYAGSQSGTVVVDDSDPVSPTFTVGGTWAVDDFIEVFAFGIRAYYQVPSGGTSNSAIATALASVIANDARLSANAATSVVTVTLASAGPATLTSGSAVNLGSSGASVTPSWTGSLVAGDYYDIQLVRPGVHYDPVSSGFESGTLYVYYDGLLHKMTGCAGTVSFSGDAGDFTKATFTITGQYHDPVDAPLPLNTVVYDNTDPQQLELANYKLGNLSVCAQNFSLDVANTVSPRLCMNQKDGYSGVRITDRAPVGSVNPEATVPSTYSLWRRFASGSIVRFGVTVGTQTGNSVAISADGAQITANAYGDRDGSVINDVTLRLNAVSSAGDDEFKLVFF